MRYNEVGDYMKEKIKTWIKEVNWTPKFGQRKKTHQSYDK